MNRNIFSELSHTLNNPNQLVLDFSDYNDYLRDATEQTGEPSALVFAETEREVQVIIAFCREHHIPIVPRGAGTGLSGGCVPVKGGLVLSTERMNKLEIYPEQKYAVCGPGVITKDLKDTAEQLGLTYPPDPASYDKCTLGGNIAECAGGLRCRKYGVTKDYVLGLRAVTADGRLLQTGIYNHNRGFALGDILIGSEGTLAIVTEITVSLIDTPPIGTTILAGFSSAGDAARTVSDITGAGIIPTIMEFIDADAVACSIEYEHSEGLQKGMAVLLFETSGTNTEYQTEQIQRYCHKNTCIMLQIEHDTAKADRLWQVRRNVSKAIKAMAKEKISEDVAVPNSKIAALVEFVAEMNRTSPLRINSFGHAGDGNIHVSFLSMTGTEEEKRLIKEGIVSLLEKTVALGGTLTGEHGIGTAKRDYLHLEFDPPTLDIMQRIKDVFDPAGILNPDKIFPSHQ